MRVSEVLCLCLCPSVLGVSVSVCLVLHISLRVVYIDLSCTRKFVHHKQVPALYYLYMYHSRCKYLTRILRKTVLYPSQKLEVLWCMAFYEAYIIMSVLKLYVCCQHSINEHLFLSMAIFELLTGIYIYSSYFPGNNYHTVPVNSLKYGDILLLYFEWETALNI